MIRPLTLLGIYGEDPSFGDPTCLAGLATNQVEIDISGSVLGYSIPLSVFPLSYLHPDRRRFHTPSPCGLSKQLRHQPAEQ